MLKDALDLIQDPQAKIVLFNSLADLYQKEGDNFQRVLALQRALSFQPNSKDLFIFLEEFGYNDRFHSKIR